MPAITHVIFDLDGLILDTERLYDVAIQNVLDPYGKQYTYELKKKIMGMKYVNAMGVVKEQLEVPLTAEELVSLSMEQLSTLFPKCGLMPGAERLIRHLAAHKVPICIATGSSSADYKLKTQNHGELVGLMEFTVRSDDPDVKHGKPDPDIFLIAMGRFSAAPASPQHCLVLEDAPNGVLAARAAGMQSVMVPDPRLKDMPPADKILKSLEEFIPEEFGLPSFTE